MFDSTPELAAYSDPGPSTSPARAGRLKRFLNKGDRSRRRRTAGFSWNGRVPESLEARTLLAVAAVQPLGVVADFDLYPSNLTPAGSNLFYLVSDGTAAGVSLAATNASGTRVLKDFGAANPFAMTDPDSGEAKIATIGNSIYFVAGAFDTSPDLWTSDGTVTGTRVLYTADHNISGLAAVGGRVFFSTDGASSGGRDALYSFVPGSTAPNPLASIPAGSISQLTAVGNAVDFAVVDPNGFTIWTSDGTIAGTASEPASRITGASISRILDVNSRAMLLTRVVNDTTYYPSYSLTQVTPSGPVTYGTFTALGTPAEFTQVGSDLYFRYVDFEIRYGKAVLARLDLATHQLDVSVTSSFDLTNLTAMNGRLFFTLTEFDGTVELEMTSGEAGIQVLKSLGHLGTPFYGGPTEEQPPLSHPLGAVGGTLYFAAKDPARGTELWKTDGTAAGTALVKDINPKAASSSPQNLVAWNGRLYFSANNGALPWADQLWTSDGTSSGTTLVGSFAPPPAPIITVESVEMTTVKVGHGKKAGNRVEILVHLYGSVSTKSALKLKNYVLLRGGRRIKVAKVRYDADSRTIILVPQARTLRFKPSLRLRIRGAGIIDIRGHALDGGRNTIALLTKGGGSIVADAMTSASSTIVGSPAV